MKSIGRPISPISKITTLRAVVAIVTQAKSLVINYSYFDNMDMISEWHQENQKKLNLEDLSPKDAIRLNPITIILERYAEVLYNHPFVRQYVVLKFRQDYILAGIIANVILNAGFVLCLNIFAFSLHPPSEGLDLQTQQQTHNNTTMEPFCSDTCF